MGAIELESIPLNNIESVTASQLCTGCGICENICPTHSITMGKVNGIFQPEICQNTCISNKGCRKCLDVCPGHQLDLDAMSKYLFDAQDSVKYDKGIGYYQALYVGYSSNYDLRYHSASGGVTTQFLIWLFEKKYIDGVVVTKFNPKDEYLVDTFIATTAEDVINAKSSKYSPVSMHGVIRKILQSDGRYAVVGLPCHIHGIRKYMDLSQRLESKIFGLFGIYCSSSKSFNATEYLLNKENVNYRNLSYLSYRDEGNLGHIIAKGEKDGKANELLHKEEYRKYNLPLRSFFIPKRCLLCPDHFAELADISLGDIYVQPYSDDKVGINSVIARNSMFNRLLCEAEQDGCLQLETLSNEKLLASQKVLKYKKQRLATFLKIEKAIGRNIPQYDINIEDNSTVKSVIAYFSSISQLYVGKRKKLWFLIDLLSKKVK